MKLKIFLILIFSMFSLAQISLYGETNSPSKKISLESSMQEILRTYAENFSPLNSVLQQIKNNEELSLADLELIENELEKFVKNSAVDRAPRTDAPTANANDAVVGKNNESDLTQILALLSMIKKRIQELQQLVCRKFEETWTILSVIEEDIFDTTTIICSKFDQTWTILERIDEDIEAGFAGTFSIFATNVGIFCEKFSATWTILGCNTAILINAPTTITNPGTYCLIQDIVGTITIAADNVILDLNEKIITGVGNGVETTGQTDITIKQGFIEGAATAGIFIDTCTNITIIGIDFANNGRGIDVVNTAALSVQNCSCRESTNDGIRLNSVNNSLVVDSMATNNGDNGIFLENSSTRNIIKNNVCNNNSDHGIQLNNASQNILEENTCQNNSLDGIRVSVGLSNILQNNKCIGNTLGSGIRLGEIITSNIDNTSVIGNECRNNGADGILFLPLGNNALDSAVKENLCIENGESGIDVRTDNVVIANNCCIGNDSAGILAGGDNTTIEANTCSYNQSGISVSSDTNSIMNNICTLNTADGIGIGISASSNTIACNKVTRNNVTGINNNGGATNTFWNNSASQNMSNYSGVTSGGPILAAGTVPVAAGFNLTVT